MTEEQKIKYKTTDKYEVGKCKTPVHTRFTKENAAEMQKRGVKKQCESKERNKAMKQIIKSIFEMPVYKGKPQELTSLAESKGINMTVEEALVLAQVQKAMKGDVRAMEFLRDTAGYKPDLKITADQNIHTEQAISDLASALFGAKEEVEEEIEEKKDKNED